MKKIKLYSGILAITSLLLSSCSTLEDRKDIDNIVTTPVDYTAKQTLGYDNQLVVTLNNTNAVVFWDIVSYDSHTPITTSNKRIDTLTLPFKGDYLLRIYTYFHSGVIKDSVKLTATADDKNYFGNPYWGLLTNSSDGKYWKLAAKYVGPQSNYQSIWWQPDISTYAWANDSIYFDLNMGFHFKKFQNDTITTGSFTIEKPVAPDTCSFAPYVVSLKNGASMPNDDASEMAPANTNKFRIFKLTTDTLIVGQGSSLTAARHSEDWSWYWLFVRK